MSAPLPEAGYLRPPKRLGTKEEVLAMLREHVANGCKLPTETREHRMQRKTADMHAVSIWRMNTFAGPHYVITGPVRPAKYEEERFRNFIGRYGQVRND